MAENLNNVGAPIQDQEEVKVQSGRARAIAASDLPDKVHTWPYLVRAEFISGCVLLLDRGQHLFAGVYVHAVDHLRDGFHTTVRFAAELPQGLKLLFNHDGDFVDDVGRYLIQICHSHRYVNLEFLGQRTDQRRCLR